MDESIPVPQADGALEPPPRVPPLALATTEPPPPPRRVTQQASRYDATVLLNRALDGLDVIGDRIAHAAGLR